MAIKFNILYVLMLRSLISLTAMGQIPKEYLNQSEASRSN